MKIFTCAVCGQTLYFENTTCGKCGHALAFLPDRGVLTAVDSAPNDALVAVDRKLAGAKYRPCGNQVDHGACNWAVAFDDDDRFCVACRLNQMIPNLADPNAMEAWLKLERAKRRLVYTLMELGLPVEPRGEGERGLAFSFMQDEPGQEKVFTGHNDGLITINIAEADAPFREKTRQELGEAYRTLLGHFRHEIGHYYWDRLIEGSKYLARFRELFGDPDADYEAAVERHYAEGAPSDWPNRFVSSYASMHPWEDWAESWAHLLHMIDTLETARSFGLALQPKPVGGRMEKQIAIRRVQLEHFDDLYAAWVPMTLALNSLNRSMGLPDLYPFVLSTAAIEKLRFVHEVIVGEANG
ncbi:MAG TPA: putative zinc-binding peptidase [Polyangia bacterium]|nr:putative zinc-binding peptidase [Polyangia bacterium]